jgi:hypothetical protein
MPQYPPNKPLPTLIASRTTLLEKLYAAIAQFDHLISGTLRTPISNQTNSPTFEEKTTLVPKTQASRPSLYYAPEAVFGRITLAPIDFAEKEGQPNTKTP